MRPPRPSKLHQEKSSELGEGTLLERGVRSPSGRRGFLSTTCSDLVMSFNSFLATGFLPALLSGEGPLVPMPATHQFTQSPSSGVYMYTHARADVQAPTHAHTCACISTHFPRVVKAQFFARQPASLSAEDKARPPSGRPHSINHIPVSPAAASQTGEAFSAQPPFLQENT